VFSPVRTVSSIDQEEELIGECSCGGAWQMIRNAVAPIRGRWYDDVAVRCEECGTLRVFEFDVSQFIEVRPQVWSRFHSTGSVSRIAVARARRAEQSHVSDGPGGHGSLVEPVSAARHG
jgi:hypothetical protein